MNHSSPDEQLPREPEKIRIESEWPGENGNLTYQDKIVIVIQLMER